NYITNKKTTNTNYTNPRKSKRHNIKQTTFSTKNKNKQATYPPNPQQAVKAQLKPKKGTKKAGKILEIFIIIFVHNQIKI
ncbi:hypothetical protein MMK25_32605, partial [Bacillus cereus]|nr:hypothetical protein [Bacillus cereus]